MELRKLLTIANIQNTKVERIDFEDKWLDAFGRPQNRGVWFVWGGSSSGKSSFAMQLAKAFAQKGKTLYNLLEEETDDSDYIDRTLLFRMQDDKDHFFTRDFTLQELDAYLEKRNSAHYIIIDSLPYFLDNWQEYKDFKKKWATKKVLVFIGHATGKEPATELQRKVMFDAKMKIFVSGFLAVCKGRTIGANGGRFIIWKEGYEAVQGANTSQNE